MRIIACRPANWQGGFLIWGRVRVGLDRCQFVFTTPAVMSFIPYLPYALFSASRDYSALENLTDWKNCFIFADKQMRKMKTARDRNSLDRLVFDKIEYVVACVGAFAQRHGLSNAQAYAYLRRFAGIDFLLDCYAAEHTLSIDDAVADMQVLCERNGGRIYG